MQGHLPIFSLLFLFWNERFGAENKTRWVHQYWLLGFRSTAPGDSGTGQETNVLAQNWNPRSWVATFCILAWLRRVLRTIFPELGNKVPFGNRKNSAIIFFLFFWNLPSRKFPTRVEQNLWKNGAKHSPRSSQNVESRAPRSRLSKSTKIIDVWYFSLIRFGPCHNLPPSRSPEEKSCPNLSSVSCLWAEKSGRENRKLHRHATENFEKSIFPWNSEFVSKCPWLAFRRRKSGKEWKTVQGL